MPKRLRQVTTGLAILIGSFLQGHLAATAPPTLGRNLRYTVVPRTKRTTIDGDLWLTAKLRNEGDRPVRVYWGDYSHPRMYRFEVKHESGWKPVLSRYWPDDHISLAAGEKYFRALGPGEELSYEMLLGSTPGANCQKCYWSRPGRYSVEPSLSILTDRGFDESTGGTYDIPDAWTGELRAEPFEVTVAGEPEALSVGLHIRGIVLSPDGRPVGGALVTASRKRAPSASFKMLNGPDEAANVVEVNQDLTDAEGRYEFFRLPAESPLIAIEVHHLDFPPKRELIRKDPERPLASRTIDLPIALEAGRSVDGHVVDSKGLPLADIRLTRNGLERYTDELGRFRLGGMRLAGESTVNLAGPALADRTLKVPAPMGEKHDWQITMNRLNELSISGKAVFADGSPLRGMELIFSAEPVSMPPDTVGFNRWHLESHTDDFGRFKVPLPLPTEFNILTVIASAPGEHHLPKGIWRTTLGRVKPRQSNLRPAFDNTLSLIAELAPSRPIPDSARIRMRCEAVIENDHRLIHEHILGERDRTARVSGLTPGRYRIMMSILPDEQVWTSRDLDLENPARDRAADASRLDPRLVFKLDVRPRVEGTVDLQFRDPSNVDPDR